MRLGGTIVLPAKVILWGPIGVVLSSSIAAVDRGADRHGAGVGPGSTLTRPRLKLAGAPFGMDDLAIRAPMDVPGSTQAPRYRSGSLGIRSSLTSDATASFAPTSLHCAAALGRRRVPCLLPALS